eukprot:scaffold48608_cov63-Phaeocystis_antarctica.AAC.6
MSKWCTLHALIVLQGLRPARHIASPLLSSAAQPPRKFRCYCVASLLFASPYTMTPKWCGHLLPATTRPHLFDTACPERPKPAPLSPAAV